MAVTRGEDDTTQLKENTPETPCTFFFFKRVKSPDLLTRTNGDSLGQKVDQEGAVQGLALLGRW